MIYLITAAVVIYIVCGILAYGLTFAYFQRKWPEQAELRREGDAMLALQTALAGPIGLMVAAKGFKYGLLFR